MKKKVFLYLLMSLLSSSIVFSSCEKSKDVPDPDPIPNPDPDPDPDEDEDEATIKISWLSKAEMPNPRYGGDAVVCNDIIYHIGGRNSQSAQKSNYAYNTLQNIWTTKAEMQVATMNLALASVGTKIYAIGGDPFLAKNESYNTTTNSWSYGAAMPTPRQHIDCGVVNGKIYVIGGLTSWDDYTGINEAYDPITDTWETKAPMPTPRHNPAIVVYNNKIYVFGGAGTPADIWTDLSMVEVYDPATDTWEEKQGLPTARFKPGAVVINDKIYVIGGFSDGVMSSRVDVYHPETDTWEDATDFPKGILFSGVVTVNNKLYISGGCNSDWSAYSSNYQGTLE